MEWITPPRRIFDGDAEVSERWFTDATLNFAWNCLDRHVAAGHGSQSALIRDSPVTGTSSVLSYSDLLDRAEAMAGILLDLGVRMGDRVLVNMSMIPDALTTMPACARIGAIHSVVFGKFAPPELAVRIDNARPKLIVAASCRMELTRLVPYKPMLDQAMALAAHPPSACLVLHRPMIPGELIPGAITTWAPC